MILSLKRKCKHKVLVIFILKCNIKNQYNMFILKKKIADSNCVADFVWYFNLFFNKYLLIFVDILYKQNVFKKQPFIHIQSRFLHITVLNELHTISFGISLAFLVLSYQVPLGFFWADDRWTSLSFSPETWYFYNLPHLKPSNLISIVVCQMFCYWKYLPIFKIRFLCSSSFFSMMFIKTSNKISILK